MRLSAIREGLALLYIPDTRQALRPDLVLEPSWLDVFYNPNMIMNRDLSVVVTAAHFAGKRGLKAIDPLSGSGVRAIRYALEVEGLEEAIANDIDPEAFSIIERNVELNHLKEKVKAANRDANALMYSLARELGEFFDLVDLDPFGSPAPYMESALSAIRRGGLLGITATDLAVLGGSKAHAAFRIYGVRLPGGRRDYREIAIRALLGFIALRAAAHEKSVRPLISISVAHYVRLFLAVERGAREALRSIEDNVGCVKPANNWVGLELVSEVLDGKDCFGPLWVGDLWSSELLQRVSDQVASRPYLDSQRDLNALLSVIRAELPLQHKFHYRLDYVCSAARTNMPSLQEMAEALMSMGYRFARSHLDAIAFRTDAPPEAVVEACRRASRHAPS